MRDIVIGGSGLVLGGVFGAGALLGLQALLAGAVGLTIVGGLGNDIIHAGSGSDTVDGHVGNDIIYGGDEETPDTLLGGAGSDVICETQAWHWIMPSTLEGGTDNTGTDHDTLWIFDNSTTDTPVHIGANDFEARNNESYYVSSNLNNNIIGNSGLAIVILLPGSTNSACTSAMVLDD
jgi:Ca2+-binding RTX toxin-like protein